MGRGRRTSGDSAKARRNTDPGFYINLGGAIRLAREMADKSQTEVAEHLDVTYQQVQKYEEGRNRIPVDLLTRLSCYLEVPVEQFLSFTTAPQTRDHHELTRLMAGSPGRENFRLLALWSRLHDRELRSTLLNLLKHMTEREDPEHKERI